MNPNYAPPAEDDSSVALGEPEGSEQAEAEQPKGGTPVGTPNGKPGGKPDPDDVEIEVVDDTPAQDRQRPPAKVDTTKIAGEDAEDAHFPADVQKRIKTLRFVYHEERRGKEKAEREAAAAIDYARKILEENQQLTVQKATAERVILDQAQRRAAAQVANAKAVYRAAHESDDADAMVKASEELSRAVSEHERLAAYAPPPQQQQQAPQQQQQQQPQYQQPQQPQYQQAPPPPDERTRSWIKRNPWWEQPGYEQQTAVARAVDQQLQSRGIVAAGETVDEYWETIDTRLKQLFPEQFGAASGAPANGQAHSQNGRTPSSRPRPVSPTAGARGPANGPVKVKLTQSQIDVARRLGLTVQQYARQIAKEQAE